MSSPSPRRFWRRPSFGWCVVLIVVVYAVGLTREAARPWNGMHEWNGALYSLFARNLDRYPWEIHHGMPVIAVGETVPAAQDRSIYPNHPAGLAWLVAISFRVLGESEWAARVVPILASLGSIVLLVMLVRRCWGDEIAVFTGILYSVLPMTVYFGRMVNHEPVCLFLMLAAVAAWDRMMDRVAHPTARGKWIAAWVVAIAAGIWIDWAGALFGGLFAAYVLWLVIRRKLPMTVGGICVVGVFAATVGMLAYIVYAGFGGRVGDLAQVFFSRSAPKPIDWPETTWEFCAGNLTWPGLVMGVTGVFLLVRDYIVRRKSTQAPPALRGLVVLLATGVLWLAVFWRQFQMHNYWMFYLGPLAALGCGWTIVFISAAAAKFGRIAAVAAQLSLLAVVVGFGFQGTEAMYRYQSLPSGNIDAWREIRRITSPDQRILIFPESTPIDDWGQTRVRFINPPQFPYYADRLFDLEDDLDRVLQRSADHALYVVDLGRVAGDVSGLKAMTGQFAWQRMGSLVLIDLRRPVAMPTSVPTSGR